MEQKDIQQIVEDMKTRISRGPRLVMPELEHYTNKSEYEVDLKNYTLNLISWKRCAQSFLEYAESFLPKIEKLPALN